MMSDRYLAILLTFQTEISQETGEPMKELTASCQNWLRQVGCEAKTVPVAIDIIQSHPEGPLFKAIQEGVDRYSKKFRRKLCVKVLIFLKIIIIQHCFPNFGCWNTLARREG